MSAPAATGFEAATAVRPAGDGRFVAAVDTAWNAPTGPNGGYVTALVVRALLAGVDPAGERRLRSVTCHYLRPPHEGELEIRVELVRSGRRFTTGRVSARQDGKEVLAGLASLSVPDLAVAGHWTPAPPVAAPAPARDAERVGPEAYRRDCGCWLDPGEQAPPITSRVKLAPQFGAPPFSGRELKPGGAAKAGGWILLHEPQAIDAAVVALFADIWWPPAFEALTAPALAPTIDLTIHVRADVPPEGIPDQPILGHFRSSAAVGGLVEEDGALYLADGTLLAQSRQLALLEPLRLP